MSPDDLKRIRDRIKQASEMCGDALDDSKTDDVLHALEAEKAVSDEAERRLAKRYGLSASAGGSPAGTDGAFVATSDHATGAVLARLDGLREAVVDLQLRSQRVEVGLERSRDASQEARHDSRELADRLRELGEVLSSRSDSTSTKVGQLEQNIGQVGSDLQTAIAGLEGTVESGAKRSLAIALGILAPAVLVAMGLLVYVVVQGG